MMSEETVDDRGRPDWLAANWNRVVAMLVTTIENQKPEDRQKIADAIKADQLEYFLDDANGVVVWQIPEGAFCEMSVDVITGVRVDQNTTTH